MTSATVAFTVDGRLLTCKGAIARLEETLSPLPGRQLGPSARERRTESD